MKQIPLFKVFMAKDAAERASEVVNSGYVGQGPKVEEFENILKKHFNNDFVLEMNSCTSALTLAVHMLKPGDKFGPDDEIITTPLTCFATQTAILANDCNIRWADVDPNNCNIDLDDVERKMGPNTRGVMVVHWGGYPVDLDRLKKIQARFFELYNRPLPIIEDCAHVWNAKYKDELIGNSGNLCTFSFQAIKFLNTFDGGLLTTTDAELYRKAKLMRWFGLDREAGQSFRCVQDIKICGFKYQPNDVSAAVGIANYAHMSANVKIHQENSAYYYENLQDLPGITLLENNPDRESSCWLFTMLVEDKQNFVRALESKGIAANPVHARCDRHSCVRKFRSSLPGMDSIMDQYICIPVGWWVTPEDREYIVNTIKKGW